MEALDCGMLEELRRALKVATDALTIARGWAMNDADARIIATALRQIIEARVQADEADAGKE